MVGWHSHKSVLSRLCKRTGLPMYKLAQLILMFLIMAGFAAAQEKEIFHSTLGNVTGEYEIFVFQGDNETHLDIVRRDGQSKTIAHICCQSHVVHLCSTESKEGSRDRGLGNRQWRLCHGFSPCSRFGDAACLCWKYRFPAGVCSCRCGAGNAALLRSASHAHGGLLGSRDCIVISVGR